MQSFTMIFTIFLKKNLPQFCWFLSWFSYSPTHEWFPYLASD